MYMDDGLYKIYNSIHVYGQHFATLQIRIVRALPRQYKTDEFLSADNCIS